MNLQETFTDILERYHANSTCIQQLWDELILAYTGTDRFYHNMQHLEQIHKILWPLRHKLRQPDIVWLALYYHDIVYMATRGDNEAQSAISAADALRSIEVPASDIQQCCAMILATKGHTISPDQDTNYFTDADLSILGQDEVHYRQYSDDIRKEYSVYPDEQYYPGRAAVLEHFLQMPRLFKTDLFYKLYEAQARNNIQKELETIHEVIKGNR